MGWPKDRPALTMSSREGPSARGLDSGQRGPVTAGASTVFPAATRLQGLRFRLYFYCSLGFLWSPAGSVPCPLGWWLLSPSHRHSCHINLKKLKKESSL